MSKTDKLIQKLKNGSISAKEARTLLRKLGWEDRTGPGSHEHWRKDGKVITIATHGKELPRYQIKQIQDALEV